MERNANWLDVDDFDVIILGTGFAESVLSGAFSRVGKRVLHLDRAEFYGGSYATLSFDQINNFVKADEIKASGSGEQKQCENEIKLESGSSPFKNKQIVIPSEEGAEREESEEVFSKKESRRFNLDLTPKMMWSNSPNVDLLIRSGVARYLEFRCLEHTYLYQNNGLQLVPCSKSDIFSNKSISLLDKRTLMKFITQMTTPEELEKIRAEHSTEPFEQFLTSRLSVTLRAFVLYAISMIGSDQSVQANRVTVAEGIERFQRYLGSLGRYGNTPFLYSLNGTSELCQAYCRLSAVYGGLFVLRRTAAKLLLESDGDKQKIKSLICTEGQELKTKHLITNLDHASNFIGLQAKKSRGTAICITNKSLTGDTLTLGVIPPNTFNNSHVIYLTQSEESAYTAPHGKYVVHLFGENIEQAREALEPVVHSLFKLTEDSSDDKPLLLWSAYFNQEIRSVSEADKPSNMHIVSDPDFELDFEQALKQVETIFKQIYPDEEFIPTVPHPEDIIWTEEAEGEEENNADPLQ
jgi:RAB protein geranylgeranyltransferase component A